MTKEDDIRELRAMVAEALNAADDLVRIAQGDSGAAMHLRQIRWLKPQAQDTLDRLRKGEHMTRESPAMHPAEALAIVVDHFERIIQESIDEMSDEEYEMMMRMSDRGQG